MGYLSNLRRKAERKPVRGMIYGQHGVGKNTFGASAPSPVFFSIEDGMGDIDAPSVPMENATFPDIMGAIQELYESDHEFKTLVIDSLDWLEPKIWAETCARGDGNNPWPDVEFPGFGKGYTAAVTVWREFFDGLNALRNDRGMHVLLLAHCQQKTYNNPETEPYDRFEPKLQRAASALVQEWADLVLFANFRTSIIKDQIGNNKKNTRSRAVGGSDRILYTTGRPSFLAKQRYNLPETLSLGIGFSGVLDIIIGKISPEAADADAA